MTTRIINYGEAISEATVQAMTQDPNVFIMGLGVDDYKGIFGTTRTAFEKFGVLRVIETPACENAMTGIALGAALNGKRPLVVHARNDFMFLALDQMINNIAKWKYTYAGKSSVPVVTRGIIGKGWGQGPTHSQSLQSIFAHFPGLYVAMPSNPYDMKGILIKALQINTPSVILEHRSLYNHKGYVPQEMFTVDFGRAKVVRQGKDVTIVATSFMVSEAMKAAKILENDGISLEIVDPISIQPLDEETIIHSVQKTGRLICADTSWARCGFASEVSAVVVEKAFNALKAPIKRITWPECPAPVSLSLENAFYRTYKDILIEVYNLLNKKMIEDLSRFEEVDTFVGPY